MKYACEMYGSVALFVGSFFCFVRFVSSAGTDATTVWNIQQNVVLVQFRSNKFYRNVRIDDFSYGFDRLNCSFFLQIFLLTRNQSDFVSVIFDDQSNHLLN